MSANHDRVLISLHGIQELQRRYEETIARRNQKLEELGKAARDNPDLPENIGFKQIKVELQFLH